MSKIANALKNSLKDFSHLIGKNTELVSVDSFSDEILAKVDRRIKMQTEAFSKPSPQEQLYYYMFEEGLRFFDDDFFDKIGNTDILEVYDVNTYEQKFANSVFFQFSNYDALTLMTNPFPRLYKREAIYDNQLLASVQKTVQTRNTVKMDIAPHIITEYAFDQTDRYRIQMKYLTPLKNADGNIECIVSTNFCLKV
jgi:hypothetical protein